MNLMLVLLLAGLALALVALVLVVRTARARAVRTQAVPGLTVDEKTVAVQRAGAARRLGVMAEHAFSTLTAVLPETPARYDVPLVLLAGDVNSGKTTMLAHAGLATAAAPHGRGAELTWHHFNQGIVLEAGASYLGLDNLPGEAMPAWDALVTSMQRYRPRRPLDAVVVTLSVDVLRGPPDVLEQHAGQMQRRLAEMQTQFGLRLPVYLMITKADLLPDFGAFAGDLPPALRTAMLGWSNPYENSAPFDQAWVGDAFDSIDATLEDLGGEIMASGGGAAGVRGFFALPPAIAALRQPARAYVSRLLGSQAHSEPVLLRGIYLCGNQNDDPLRPAPAFVRDVMACKVFAERGMAQPLRGQMLSRDRRVRFMRAATVLLVAIWLPALVYANLRLERVSGELLATLTVINAEASERKRANDNGGHKHLAFYRDASNKIVSGMLAHSSSLVSYAIPFSWHWFDPAGLDEAIDKRFKKGLEMIVLPTIRKGFNLRANGLTGTPLEAVTVNLVQRSVCQPVPGSFDATFAPQTTLSELDAFRDLNEYVHAIDVFGSRLEQFRKLQTESSGGLKDLDELGDYTEAFDVPERHRNADSGYLRRALHELVLSRPEAPAADYKPAIECALEARHETLLTRLFTRHPLPLLADSIGQQLHGGHADGAAVNSYDRLGADLHGLKEWLGAPASAWLHARRASIDKPYVDLLALVAASEWAGPDKADALRKKTAARLDYMEERLMAARGSAVLQRSTDGARIEMSPPVARAEQALSGLMAQSFMAPPPARMLNASVDAPAVMWDLNGLNRLLLLAGEQQAYLTQSIGTFPVGLQTGLRQFADKRLADNIVAGIDGAQAPASDPMAAWVRLGQAQKVLSALLETLDRLGARPERQALGALLASQAESALAGIDAAFEEQGAYLPKGRNFAWWTGNRNPAAQGFVNGDPAALDDYLAAQHEQVERSAKLARPLVRLYLDGEGAPNAALVKRWSGIGRELERFADKAPGARVAALHSFIRADLAELDQQNCQAKAVAAAGGASDFFALRTRELGQRVALRCAELGRSGGSSAYATLAGAFRGSLANKFPFAPVRDQGGMAAEPDDVAAFIQAWDKVGPQAQLLVRGDAPARARGFVGAAERARAFLAPLLPLDPAEEAGYDLRVRFRVNEHGDSDGNNALAGEIDGNRIVEWTLQVGDQTVRFRNGEQGEPAPLRWRIGMPVLLTLRWADNSPTLPRADEGDPHMRVVGREVQYRFGEPWSLLRMLGQYRVVSARGETLRFDVPLVPAAIPNPAPARVFMRVALSPANKKTPLAWPAFPTDAPPLEATIQARLPAPIIATGGSR